MNTHRIIATRVLAFAFVASAMVAAPHLDRPRTVDFGRTGPCSTCGPAAPVTITCEGLDWIVYAPGTVPAAAASVCPPGTTYTWRF